MKHIITYKVCTDIDNSPFDSIYQIMVENFDQMQKEIEILQLKHGHNLHILLAAELKYTYEVKVTTKISLKCYAS